MTLMVRSAAPPRVSSRARTLRSSKLKATRMTVATTTRSNPTNTRAKALEGCSSQRDQVSFQR